MKYGKIASITIITALLLTSCGTSDTPVTSDTSATQTDMISAETTTETDTTSYLYADKMLFPCGQTIQINSETPLCEKVIDTVAVDDSFFTDSNVSLLYGECDRVLYESYVQLVFDGEPDEADRSVIAYDTLSDKAFVTADDDMHIMCDGQATYAIIPSLKSYVKRDEANLAFVDFAKGSRENDVASLFDHNGVVVEYDGETYYRFTSSYGQAASQDMGYEVISYYYFNEDGDVKYNVELFGDRLVTGVYIEQLTSDFDDSCFVRPSDYSEFKNDEIMDSLFDRWGIQFNGTEGD